MLFLTTNSLKLFYLFLTIRITCNTIFHQNWLKFIKTNCMNVKMPALTLIDTRSMLFEVLSSMSMIKWLSLLLGIAQIWLAQLGPIKTQRNLSAKAGRLIKNKPHAFWLAQAERVKFEQCPRVKTAIWSWKSSIKLQYHK